ncbi:tetratricopeptide repeat protein [Hahella ganghwensis]|uniref:tetratricopeptide repeat protein n=1 Tax=Hahella ganghwensis TaxID=286420 RepID=UPI0003A4720C|nr:tetratricopeptide repeat protein [Hahella ganghwensis]
MSLLNDVLRDLDKQNAQQRDLTGLPPGLTGAGNHSQSRMKLWWWLILFILLILVGGFGWISWQKGVSSSTQLVPAISETTGAVLESPTSRHSLNEESVQVPENGGSVNLAAINEETESLNPLSDVSQEEIPGPIQITHSNSASAAKLAGTSVSSRSFGSEPAVSQLSPQVSGQTLKSNDVKGFGVQDKGADQSIQKTITKPQMKVVNPQMLAAKEPAKSILQQPSTKIVKTAPEVEKAGSERKSEASPGVDNNDIQLSQSPAAVAARGLREARQLYQSGNTREAEQILWRQLAEQPDMEASRKQLALWLLARGGVRETLNVLSDVNENSSDGLREVKAHALVASGKEADAVNLLNFNPPASRDFPQYQSLRAGLLQQAGQYEEALEVYAELVDADPRRGDWWAGLAIALDQTGRVTSAVRAYQQALGDPKLSGQLSRYARQRIEQLNGFSGNSTAGS